MPPSRTGDDMKIDWNAVAKVGIPGVIALFLVYRLSMGFEMFERRLNAQDEKHAAMIVEQQNLGRAILKLADKQGESQAFQQQILGVMRVMCIQGAVTPADRRECLKE